VLLSIFYRPGWTAKTEVGNLEVSRAVEGLVAVKLPPGISVITLSYKPTLRVVFFHLTWITVLISIIALVFLCGRGFFKEKVVNQAI
jgi:uncharacterized membrane protein YfhO